MNLTFRKWRLSFPKSVTLLGPVLSNNSFIQVYSGPSYPEVWRSVLFPAEQLLDFVNRRRFTGGQTFQLTVYMGSFSPCYRPLLLVLVDPQFHLTLCSSDFQYLPYFAHPNAGDCTPCGCVRVLFTTDDVHWSSTLSVDPVLEHHGAPSDHTTLLAGVLHFGWWMVGIDF